MKFYNTYLFDFDYTIADSSVGIIMSFNEAFRAIGIDYINPSEIKKTIGKSLFNAFVELSGGYSDYDYLLFQRKFMATSKEVMVKYSYLYDSVIDLFKELKINQCSIGIVTSKDKNTVSKILQKYNCGEFVDVIVGEDNVQHQKPNSEPIDKAIKLLGLDYSNTVYVGDCVVDALTAQNAKVDFYAVLSGVETKADFVKHHCDVKCFFRSVTQLLDYIRKN